MNLSSEHSLFERLVQKVYPESHLLRAWTLKGGISAKMALLEIESPGGGGETIKVVFRQPGKATLQHNPHAAEDEFKVLRLAQSLGLAAPAPLYLDPGDLFTSPTFLIEYVDGEPDFRPADLAGFSRQLADHLAKIHSADYSNRDVSFLPRRSEDFSTLFGARPPHPNPIFLEAYIRERLAAARPAHRPNPPALLHGDYWPGNILWRNGQLAVVIDWEDAALGDPLVDLAISRLDLLWIMGVQAMDAFTRQYQARMPVDYTSLPYWDLYAALRLVRMAGSDLASWAAFFAPYGRDDITEQSIMDYYQYFINQALKDLQVG